MPSSRILSRRLAAVAFSLAALLLANGPLSPRAIAQEKPDGAAVLEKVKDGAGLTKVKEKLAADAVGSRFRVDGFGLNDDKALKVTGVVLVPGGTAEDQAEAEKAIQAKVVAAVQEVADAKEFKDFEFAAKAVKGAELPNIVLQKAANEAGKTDRAADQLKFADAKFDAKGQLVITGVRGSDAKTLEWANAAAKKSLAENPAATDAAGKEAFKLDLTAAKDAWPLSAGAIQKELGNSRVRIDRAFLVANPAKLDETNPTGIAWAYGLTGLVIGNDKPDAKAIGDAVAKAVMAAGWPAIKDADLEALTNADNRVPDPAPQFQKAIAAKPALDGVRIDSRTEFSPDGKLVLAGVQPGLDDKQLGELTQTIRSSLAALGTGGDANPNYKKLAELSVSLEKLQKVKVRELHAELRKWATESLDDVRLNRLYFDEQSKLVLTCEAPDDAVKGIVERQLLERATKVIPGLKAEPPAMPPITEPKEPAKKDPEEKKDPKEPEKKEPEKKEPEKKDPDDKKDPEKKDPKEPEKKDAKEPEKKEPKDEKKDPEEKKEPEKKEPEKKDTKEPEKKEPEKKEPEEKKEPAKDAAFIVARVQDEAPKTTGGVEVQFTKFKGGLTKYLQQVVADPKNKQWDALLIERGYFNENDQYTVRGVASSEDQRKAFNDYLDSLKSDPQWGPYFSPKPHAAPDLVVISMPKFLERAQRVMPAYRIFDGIGVSSAKYVYVDDKTDPGPRLVFEAQVVGQPNANAATALSKLIEADRKFYGRRLPRSKNGEVRAITIVAVPMDVVASDQVGNFTEGFGSVALLKGEMAKAKEWVDAGRLHTPHLASVWFLSAYYNHLKGDKELVRRDLYRMIEIEDPIGFDGPYQRKRRYRVAKDLQGETRDQMEKIWLVYWKEFKEGGQPMTFAESK